MKKKNLWVVAICFFAMFLLYLPNSHAQTIGGGDDKIYDNRLCSVKPGENKGTECRIENPEGLCSEYSTCP